MAKLHEAELIDWSRAAIDSSHVRAFGGAPDVELDEILDEQDLRWRRTDMAPKPPPPGWFNPSRAPRSRRSELAESD